MKQFFKFVFASMLGFILSAIVIFIILIAGITAVISSSSNKVEIKDNTILHVNLNLPITERSASNPLDNLDIGPFKGEKMLGLDEILKSIKTAKTDDHIKGIYLDVTYMMTGFATIEEIRNALVDFKKSGKFIIAYSEIYTQGAYYLASVADKIYLNPQGILELKGFSSEITFYKGALDKLNIEAQIIKVGTYKSAVEPYILEKMSDANRLQTTALLGSLYQHFTAEIAASRKIPQDSIIAIADGIKSRAPEDAVKYKLVDALKYKDEVLAELKSKTGIDEKDNLKTVSITEYAKSIDKSNSASDRIAVIYANGDINGGEGDENSIGSEGISRALRKARLDDKVKAIVFRVNSPGGSSLASDVIWREVVLTKKVKPIIVSMGDYAASGGYYISCAADSIFAEPNTITGSIGVFAIIPNMKGFFNDKLGVTFDNVKTGKFADLGDITRPLTPAEKLILQTEVNRTYADFTKRVAEGRHLSQAYVDSIGQGRVWTGEQAIKLKLVDKLGHIDDAIAAAAKKANLKEYKIVNYPEIKSGFMGLIDNSEDKIQTYMVKKELGLNYTYYQQLKEITNMKGIQARMPYQIKVQ
ncbi:MAG: signal peptide peptidase SppA [Bacteroidetes bacterium]|nr:signal peptide peptidase SppA [Bacteroidota bacterium]MBU1371397.1 signal peptide peptidase SppA [Bacteroidota bacterium]MBU1485668.1 signal peptide peptidase SppA [Bacteroidota bacterium]MBU1761900.1 signal peptide peptidase SppA [Bacteroidota bacterium]MBU2266928.1 signal peptide peptidase SppA [Bacteroidota bacterium]